MVKQGMKAANLSQDQNLLFNKLQSLIDQHQSFIITTHVVPDGDGLGGEVALSAYIRAMGKRCRIINADPTPEKFSLADSDHEIEIWDEHKALPPAEIIFGVDVNDKKRIGPLWNNLEHLNAKLIFIDHHLLEDPQKSQHIIDEEVSSMGEFFYRFFHYVKAEISFKMALAMYVSLATDTKQFRHRKTTALSHAIAAALVEVGVRPEMVHETMHRNRSLQDIYLLGEALKRVRTTADQKIAWIEISQTLQKKYGATAEESQGFADYLLRLKHVEVGLLFREEPDGRIKVSFRSQGRIEIFPTVKKFGGGGHAFEAGALIDGPMRAAVKSVLNEIKKLV